MTIFWVLACAGLGLLIMHFILRKCFGSYYEKEGLVLGLGIGAALFMSLLIVTALINFRTPYDETLFVEHEVNASVIPYYVDGAVTYIIYKDTETRNEVLVVPTDELRIIKQNVDVPSVSYDLNIREEQPIAHRLFPWAFDRYEKMENYVLILPLGDEKEKEIII